MQPLKKNRSVNILERNTGKPISVLDYVNNLMKNKEKAKEKKKTTLNEWGDMKKTEKTDELKLEWKFIQHSNLYAKNEYNKIKKDEKMPNYFQVATVVNANDKIKVGAGQESQSAHTTNRRKKKSLSALQLLERNNDLKKWCVKKYTQIQKEKNIGGKSFLRKHKKELLKKQKS
ncbi:rRNA-processing protein, putative [Hepatocystis sp. ex Piliocolobus tephrosceles]|nr:rRNA-processing protein, putative [Hepatocystis sp. ex Piliocolobus tephrosceles]